jgi:hypothetical protein
MSSDKKITNHSIYLHKFDENEKKLKEKEGKFITPFQFEKAKEIYDNFNYDKKILSLVVAETQMGKTGIMQALTYEFVKNGNIEPTNILILTGLSSCEWVKQTRERFIDMIRPNIFHRNSIEKFREILEKQNDLLIFFDEVHIANELKNEIGKTFLSCGLLNINNLIERNIKIIQISATPDIALSELYEWDETNYNVSIIKSPDNYIGIQKLLDNNQIFEYKSLLDINNVKEIRQIIEIKYGNNFKYHLLRVKTNAIDNAMTMNNIKSVFNNDKDKKIFLIRNYSNDDDEIALIDLNKSYLNYQPNKHTIIIIKEKIRCSYTINKTHIGILYERKAETVFQNETTIIQGFLGRACGYYDNSNRNIIIYTNLNIVHNYLLKIKNEHEKELYKIKKNKKIINDKDINYNITSCITDITFDIKNKKIKEYNIKVIKDHDIDIENELINGINKKDVYNKIIFDKILKNNNYYDIFYQHDNTYKRTSNENITEKIKEAINNKTYIDYKDITGINKSQCKKITESLKSIIVVVNSRQNEIYLLHYYKDT